MKYVLHFPVAVRPVLRHWLLLLPFLFLLFTSTKAHPGIGIVCDSQGNIFFTDLSQVWKIAPDGSRKVAVPNVHTHEICLDAEGNLYGEHLWYEGEATDKWGHYVWRLTAAGQVEIVKDSTEGFLTDYSFVRDPAGNLFWVERGDTCRFQKSSLAEGGRIETFAAGIFKDVRWQFYLPKSGFHFLDEDNLYQIQDGKFILTAKDLRTGNLSLAAVTDDSHSVFGVWEDAEGNLFAAVTADDAIKKIAPDGTVSVIFKSKTGWSPTGGVFDLQGNLWVLENSKTNQVRVEKVNPADLKSQVRKGKPMPLLPVAALSIVMLAVLLWVRRRLRKR